MLTDPNTDKAVFYQGEARPLTFKITINNQVMDLSLYTFALQVRKHFEDGVPLISKADADFDKLYAGSGLVTVTLGVPDLAEPGIYKGQLSMTLAGVIRKTDLFDLEIKQAVIGRVSDLSTTILAVTSASEPILTIT